MNLIKNSISGAYSTSTTGRSRRPREPAPASSSSSLSSDPPPGGAELLVTTVSAKVDERTDDSLTEGAVTPMTVGLVPATDGTETRLLTLMLSVAGSATGRPERTDAEARRRCLSTMVAIVRRVQPGYDSRTASRLRRSLRGRRRSTLAWASGPPRHDGGDLRRSGSLCARVDP